MPPESRLSHDHDRPSPPASPFSPNPTPRISSNSSSSSNSNSSSSSSNSSSRGGYFSRVPRDTDGHAWKQGQAVAQSAVISIDGSSEDDREELLDAKLVPMLSSKKAVSMLAKELTLLSVAERNEILHSVHGVADPVAEDDLDMVDYALFEMQLHLDSIRFKPAYNRAAQLSPSYVHDRHFRLIFLRANRFDSKAAAKHVVVHFQEKQNLFGCGDLLAKDIAYEDLNEIDRRALKCGRNALSPWRDSTGRPVVQVRFPAMSKEDYENGFLNNVMRASWYFICSLVRSDINAQRLGIVVVAQNNQRPSHPETYGMIQEMARRRRGWPVNVSAAHYCGAATSQMVESMPLIQLLLEKHVRIRFRTHLGTDEQIDRELKAFGIPFQVLPLVASISSPEASLVSVNQVQARLREFHQRFDSNNRSQNGNSVLDYASHPQVTISTSSSAEELVQMDMDSAQDAYYDPLFLEASTSTPVHVPIEELDIRYGQEQQEQDVTMSYMDLEQVTSAFYSAADTPVTFSGAASITITIPPMIRPHEDTRDSDAVELIECPNECSVLFGRGSSRDHPGNLRMHQLVNDRLDEYERARKLEKTAMSEMIVREIQANGGKFLRHYDGTSYWVETKDEDAREKVGKIFRRMIQLRREGR